MVEDPRESGGGPRDRERRYIYGKVQKESRRRSLRQRERQASHTCTLQCGCDGEGMVQGIKNVVLTSASIVWRRGFDTRLAQALGTTALAAMATWKTNQ